MAPVALPQGWKYTSAGGSSGPESTTLTLDFVKASSDETPLPAVQVCIVASEDTDLCRSDGNLQGVEIPTAPKNHSAVMFGSADAISDWATIKWTTDLNAVNW